MPWSASCRGGVTYFSIHQLLSIELVYIKVILCGMVLGDDAGEKSRWTTGVTLNRVRRGPKYRGARRHLYRSRNRHASECETSATRVGAKRWQAFENDRVNAKLQKTPPPLTDRSQGLQYGRCRKSMCQPRAISDDENGNFNVFFASVLVNRRNNVAFVDACMFHYPRHFACVVVAKRIFLATSSADGVGVG